MTGRNSTKSRGAVPVLEDLEDRKLLSPATHNGRIINNQDVARYELQKQNHVPLTDRRISRRELAHAFESLQQFDLNGDGAITAVELAGRFQGVLQLGKPVLFRNQGMRGNATAPIANRPSAGPDWFRKMDRNRDGDVSPREFLGPLAAFKKLDTDGDGKISQAEFTKGKKKSSKAEAAFKAKDKDNDGFLTEEEFKGHGKKKKNK